MIQNAARPQIGEGVELAGFTAINSQTGTVIVEPNASVTITATVTDSVLIANTFALQLFIGGVFVEDVEEPYEIASVEVADSGVYQWRAVDNVTSQVYRLQPATLNVSVNNWILAAGEWNDSRLWDDNSLWVDG